MRTAPQSVSWRASRHAALWVFIVLAGVLVALATACAVSDKRRLSESSDAGSSVGAGADGGLGSFTGDGGFGSPGDGGSPPVVDEGGLPPFTGPLAGPFTDLPQGPVLDMPDGGAGAPSSSAQLFGPPSQGAQNGGPCLIEPEDGALFPNNWLRPRFAWIANGENLFELRLHVQNQMNDLVVYTTQTSWTMPKAMWDKLRTDSQDQPMTVTIRGGVLNGSSLSGEALGSSGSLGIAPVGAPGTIVYWAIDGGQGGTGYLAGFTVGDEGVITVLTGSQVQQSAASPGNRACIGCHAATPDGLGVGFQAEWLGPNGGYNNSIATIGRNAAPGAVPSYLSLAAGAALAMLAGAPTYSPAHWKTGDRIEILSNTGTLTWVDLEGTGARVQGAIARSLGADAGDMSAATAPTWSHDGNTIVYTSVPPGSVDNGRAANGPMDLYAVPYNNRAGGNATPLSGASDPSNNDFNPAFSPDDRFVAFDKTQGNGDVYNQPSDEISVVPASGGTATRLLANDPPACTGRTSPGVTNSWAKWSPMAQTVPALSNTTYYWIVFSSTRTNYAQSGQPQLYISPIVVDAKGNVTSYHSLYLWNQPAGEENHLPAWDVFQIPPVPPPVPQAR